MSVTGLHSITLEVPELEPGIRFYTDAGLAATVEGSTARLACAGQELPSIVLQGGRARKRLHHLTLRAKNLDAVAASATAAGGTLVARPSDCAEPGDDLWVADPHGMMIRLVDAPEPKPLEQTGIPFAINAPGQVVRIRRSAILPGASYPPARPLRLGHVLLFTPDVLASVAFMTDGLGMGLADRAQEVIAFCCTRRNSDHHVVAFAKSPSIGFHHASFQLTDPDAVGRAGRDLRIKAGRGHWGFGRHTIGSNFFHYIQDPWGSWLEYYSDMDFIDDHALWTATNYEMTDSLASWGPDVPEDFVHNYEAL